MIHEHPWDRTEQTRDLRDRIWRYVSPASTTANDVLPAAAALLQLPRADREYLTDLHLLLSPEARAFTEAAPGLMRQLTTSTTVTVEEHPERIRGPVDWPATLVTRSVRGVTLGYATRPTERVMSTPENRLLVATLRIVRSAYQQLGWSDSSGEVGTTASVAGATATRLLASPVLRTVREPLQPRDLWRTRRGRASRRFHAVAALWDLHHRLVELEDLKVLQQLVESTALVAATDGAMLELVALFRVIGGLEATGWTTDGLRLVRGRVEFLYHRLNGEELTLGYQATPRDLSDHDRYRDLLSDHGVPSASLRPDLVLDHRPIGARRTLIVVEVKYRRRAADAARDAALNALAYREAYRTVPIDSVYIGAAWGRGLTPVADGDVLLCSIEHLASTVAMILAR